MLSIPKSASIYFYSLPVDLRKGFEGLAFIANTVVQEIPEESYFVFLNRKRNRIKILYWTSANLFYWFVRSREGVFAPKKTKTDLITRDELDFMLKGKFPERLIASQNSL